MNSKDASELLISIARRDEGRVEVSRNRAPWIKKLWPSTSYPEGYDNREPYCAAGMCHALDRWIHELAIMGELRKTLGMGLSQAERWRCKDARAFGWRDWAVAKKLTVLPDSKEPKAGDFVVYDFSHIGLVIQPMSGGLMETVEYNTNSQGSRDGDGCWTKVRPRSIAQCFIRILP